MISQPMAWMTPLPPTLFACGAVEVEPEPNDVGGAGIVPTHVVLRSVEAKEE